MTEWRWAVLDATGTDIEASEPFASKDDAEAWMSREWSALFERGGESVALRRDGDVEYEMGLREA